MATVCYINTYNSSIDRGTTVHKTPIKHVELDEDDITEIEVRLVRIKFHSELGN